MGGWRAAALAGLLLAAVAGGTGLYYGYRPGGADGDGAVTAAGVPVAPDPAPAAPHRNPTPDQALAAPPHPGPPPAPSVPPAAPSPAAAIPPAPAQMAVAPPPTTPATPAPAVPDPAVPDPVPVVARPSLPAPDRGSRPAWQRFAVPSAPIEGRPAIAIVIDDMGVDRRRSAQVVALPGPLTLSWLPYARDLARQTGAAHSAGHELMVHLPMEPLGAADPGPGAILTTLSPEELSRRLAAGLDAFEGYVGVNNHMGSRFTQDRAGMRAVLEELERRGLLFLDSRTIGKSVGYAVARELKMPAIGRDVFIDHDMAPAAVRASLEKLERIARRQGHAVAIGHPHDATIRALAEWLPTLPAKGLALVPISALVREQVPGL